jgi:hypothetical protein
MQFEDDWFYTSLLNATPNPYEFNQYTPFPIKTGKAYNDFAQTLDSYTANATFDSLDRLVSFTGFLDDGPLYPQVWKLSYYK